MTPRSRRPRYRSRRSSGIFALSLSLLVGCSGPRAAYVPIARSDEVLNQQGGASSVQLEPVDDTPHLWRIVHTTLPPLNRTFATAVEECGPRKLPSPAALARQLFVGLKEVKVKRQEQREIGNTPLLYSRIGAQQDGKRLEFASFVALNRGCVLDIVFWSETPEELERLSSGELHELVLRILSQHAAARKG
jgi:hypothetical protein